MGERVQSSIIKNEMKTLLERLFREELLSEQEAHDLLLGIADKVYPEVQVAALMAVLRLRGVSVDELLGFRRALLERAVSVDLSEFRPIDIVGTGGDGKNTFNVSTCACFVVAGAGYKIAKHGNYGASSVSGASTVLELHGVKFTNEAYRLRRSIEGSGVAYLHAPLFHPALAAVGPMRRALGVRTVFNLLGPLVNPSRPASQLLGVADLEQLRLYTNTLRRTGQSFAVVTSFAGYDEISLTSGFKVTTGRYETIYNPSDLGLPTAIPAELYGGATPAEAKAVFDAVLENRATAGQQACVEANAAFAILAASPEKPIVDCLAEAHESIESGRALAAFKRFVELNG